MQVMLHTFMDCIQEEGVREVNHHGRRVTVDTGDKKMFRQRGDQGSFYQRINCSCRVDYLKISQFAAKKGIPIVIISFSILYWSYGLFYFFYPAL